MTQKSSNKTEPAGRVSLIRAAVRLFGRDGFDGTPLMALAEEAGVSWGLIRFYFGSKEGLREAAEEWVAGHYLGHVAAGVGLTNREELFRMIEETTADLPEESRFLRRAFSEDRPIASEVVQQLIALHDNQPHVEQSEAFAENAWLADPMAQIASRIGYLLLAPQFIKHLGRDPFSAEEMKERNARQLRLNELVKLGLETELDRKRALKWDAHSGICGDPS